jgi:hypothetical protein
MKWDSGTIQPFKCQLEDSVPYDFDTGLKSPTPTGTTKITFKDPCPISEIIYTRQALYTYFKDALSFINRMLFPNKGAPSSNKSSLTLKDLREDLGAMPTGSSKESRWSITPVCEEPNTLLNDKVYQKMLKMDGSPFITAPAPSEKVKGQAGTYSTVPVKK